MSYKKNSDFPYQKELLFKERIRSHRERILSFQRSSIVKRDAIKRIIARSSSLPLRSARQDTRYKQGTRSVFI